jgi:hypothetical protein
MCFPLILEGKKIPWKLKKNSQYINKNSSKI